MQEYITNLRLNLNIVKSLEYSGVLLNGVSEKIQNEAKKQKGGFLIVLLDTLGAILLGNMLAGRGINRTGYGSKELRSKGGGMIGAGYM